MRLTTDIHFPNSPVHWKVTSHQLFAVSFCWNSRSKVDALHPFPEMAAGLIYKATKVVINHSCWNRLWKVHSIPCGNCLLLRSEKMLQGEHLRTASAIKISLCVLHLCVRVADVSQSWSNVSLSAKETIEFSQYSV